jgi:hypothetical protein
MEWDANALSIPAFGGKGILPHANLVAQYAATMSGQLRLNIANTLCIGDVSVGGNLGRRARGFK